MSYFQGMNVIIKKEPNLNESLDTENIHDYEDPGSRCGEIYVGNNAKKWTFICTFCDKSVREIDEFINHIKYAHVNLPPPLPVDNNDADHRDQPTEHTAMLKNDVPLLNPLDKALPEFVDYNDFLDVNVQTVPEVILSDTSGHMEAALPETPARIKTEPDSEKEDTKELQSYKPSMQPWSMSATMTSQPPQLVAKSRKRRKSRSRSIQIRGPVFCKICKRTFKFHSLYKNHMVKHTSETPFVCTICNKGFKSKQAIRYHTTTHQREKPFKCELCKAGFYHEWQFVSHMETHRSEKFHPCEVCGKLNRDKSEKEAHMRTHTGDRPFACEFCLKRFRLRHHLSNHLKLHLTYRCDFCRQQFSNSVPLKKPYACPDCYDVPRYQPGDYIEEVNDVQEDYDDEKKDETFHPLHSPRGSKPVVPHTCKICHKTYANKRGLSVHTTTKH